MPPRNSTTPDYMYSSKRWRNHSIVSGCYRGAVVVYVCNLPPRAPLLSAMACMQPTGIKNNDGVGCVCCFLCFFYQ